jgi:hypothetical protein
VLSADTLTLTNQAYATVFCQCGWLMAGANGDQVYCENPKCKERGKIFKLVIVLEEVQPHVDKQT